MAEQKPRLVMDIVVAPSIPKPRAKQETYLETVIAKLRTIHVRFSKKVLYVLAAIILVTIVSLAITARPHLQPKVPDPVPLSIRRQVPFDVYFPNPAKLPAGYSLDTQSFSAGNNAVVYKITHGTKGSVVVTVQPKISDVALRQFYKVHMPLTIPIKTSVGTAALGVLNNETVISLPTDTNAWLLMTAPLSTSQTELDQVTKSMTAAQ